MRLFPIATLMVPLGLHAATGCGGELRTSTELPPACPTNPWCAGISQCRRALPACPGQAAIVQTCTCIDEVFTCPAAPARTCPPPDRCDAAEVLPGQPCAPENAGRACPGLRNPECPEEPAVLCTCSNGAYSCPVQPACVDPDAGSRPRDAGTDG